MLKLLYQPLAVVIITIIALVICASLYVSTFQVSSSSQRIALLQADVERQKAATEQLAQKLTAAQNAYSKEKIVRDQLLMQKPGEYVVQIPDLPFPSVAPAAKTTKTSPWESWKKLLF